MAQNSFPLSWYGNKLHGHEHARPVEVVTPDWGSAKLKAKQLNKSDCIIGTWLGHAGALVEVPLPGTGTSSDGQASAWLLFDPIFSWRAGPTGYTGPSRLKPNPCSIEDLPGCDAVFISHNHYDHLDLPTIKAIAKKFPNAKYYVPLGLRIWLVSAGILGNSAVELDWWQDHDLNLTDLGYKSDTDPASKTSIRITCVPAQHNSGRTALDSASTLWCGWVAERLLTTKDESGSSDVVRKGAIFHAGDTGYRRSVRSDVVCPAFKEIGEKFGPFDLSFIPIWRGGTLGFISWFGLRLSHHDIPSALHISPADAIAIHKDVKSRNTIGVHFGTFIGSENESYEAIIELVQACKDSDVAQLDANECKNGRAGVIDIGESYVVEIK